MIIKQDTNAFNNGVNTWLVINPIKYDVSQSYLTSSVIFASITIIEYIRNPLNPNPEMMAIQFFKVNLYLSSSNSSEIG
jgi:hypothetical protein